MDNRPIGVFDSGVGGLTAMRQLIRLLPGERFVYFGDTGRVPYGGRSTETLIQYARQDVVFLRSFDPKAIVVACGTVSTVALSLLAEELPLPILGVVEPAARAAAERTKNGRVGVVGTKATIRSGAYERAIRGLTPGIEIVSRRCSCRSWKTDGYGRGTRSRNRSSRSILRRCARPALTRLCSAARTIRCCRS